MQYSQAVQGTVGTPDIWSAIVLLQMIHAVHATEGGEDIRMGTHPTEGPTSRAVVGVDGLQLIRQFLRHTSEGATTQGFHHDILNAQFLTFIIEVLCISIRSSATTHRGMCPVEEVHLDLHEIPMVLIVVVEQPVEVTYITVIREP